jgi:hypothetical protein
MIPPQERTAGNRSGNSMTGGRGANRNAAATGGGTNATALVEVNIGFIQANIGSRSQYNTAEGSAREAIGVNDATGRGSGGGTMAPVIHANVGASGSSNLDCRSGNSIEPQRAGKV